MYFQPTFAIITQLVECHPSKVDVARSNRVYRSSGMNVTSVVVAPRIVIGSLIGALQQAVTNELTKKEMVYPASI